MRETEALLLSAGRTKVTLKMAERAIFKIDRQTLLLAFFAARLIAVDIIPTIWIKRVGDQRRAEHKLDLTLSHPWT